MVLETFFRGYSAQGEDESSLRRFALFAVPTDAPPEPPIEVIGEDRAGNVGSAAWPVVLKERVLPRDDIQLPQSHVE